MTDGAERVRLPVIDDPPPFGGWVDHDDLQLTEEEIVEGNRLGEMIDINDDGDNGGVA